MRWTSLMKRGQAAMEFLMTYGWAILVVLAAIGALAYFGVLSPDKFLPDKCSAAPPFSCTQYKLSAASNTVAITLTANSGTDITPSSVTMSCDGVTIKQADGDTLNASGVVGTTVLPNGNSFTLSWTGATLQSANCGGVSGSALQAGNKFKATYLLNYTKSGETVSHTATGSIQARIE